MKWMILFLLSVATACHPPVKTADHPATFAVNDKILQYEGRVNVSADSACIYWPGTSITIPFKGSYLNMDAESRFEPAWFYAIIDGDEAHAKRILVDTRKQIFLARDLNDGEHVLKLVKLTNNTSTNIIYKFYGSRGSTKLTKHSRKLEFYGDSITAGHGVDTPEGQADSGAPEHFNNYWTYSAITSRHFNAQYSCVARSGIGITISWFPEIMPEIWNRVDPRDPSSIHDFAYQPDAIVVNLFQNDSWLTTRPEHPQFKARFGSTAPTPDQIVNAYANFIRGIRAKNPNTEIFCVLGNMDITRNGSPWPGYVSKAVELLKDEKIHTVFFPYKNTPGHPKRNEQKAMADQLIPEIARVMHW